MDKLLLNKIKKSTKYSDLFEIPWELLQNKKCNKCGKGIKIVILNTPCNGFGDLMFAHKLALLIRNKYGCRIDIASTHPEKLTLLGENKNNIVALKTKSNNNECRRFKYLDKSGLKIKYDLIFVAPVNQDYDPSFRDVRYLIPYSNQFNTFFFSEYNDLLEKNFDFPVGVGKGYFGLLLTKPKISKITRKYPYALAYIAGGPGDSHIPLWRNCIFGFVQMIAKKYKNNKVFEIVGPESSLKYVYGIKKTILIELIGKYFGTIKFISKNSKNKLLTKIKILSNKPNTLILNGSVFPVTNTKMLSLMKYSVKDILLTGDQSITDGLSCCPNKNIWYQIVPWKYDFVDNLTLKMPNKYLGDIKTSCGTIKTIKFRSDYKKFINENNFIKNAEKKLTGIILAAKESKKKNSWVSKYEKEVLSVRGIKQFKNKVGIQ